MKHFGPTKREKVVWANQYAARYVRYGRYYRRQQTVDPVRNMTVWFSIFGVFVASMFLVKMTYEHMTGKLMGAPRVQVEAHEPKKTKIISPIPEEAIVTPSPLVLDITKVVKKQKEVIKKVANVPAPKDYDIWVGEAVDEFFGNDRDKSSEMRMIMHCLLNRESHHSTTIAHGDGGMAGGPLQYWEETWTRMRSRMIQDGYASDMSSRYNMKDAIFTTVYAISKGWGKEWGPILRDYNGAGWSTCQTPSWYE